MAIILMTITTITIAAIAMIRVRVKIPILLIVVPFVSAMIKTLFSLRVCPFELFSLSFSKVKL